MDVHDVAYCNIDIYDKLGYDMIAKQVVLINVPWFGSDGKHQMNILLFYYDFNLDVELIVCALLTKSIHFNRLTEQPFVLFNLLICCLKITVETHQKYHRGMVK